MELRQPRKRMQTKLIWGSGPMAFDEANGRTTAAQPN
jgi:hypothetical protein